jgi:hypothetical protein
VLVEAEEDTMKERWSYITGAFLALAFLLAGCVAAASPSSSTTAPTFAPTGIPEPTLTLGKIVAAPLSAASSVDILAANETENFQIISYELTRQMNRFAGTRSYSGVGLSADLECPALVPLAVMEEFLQRLADCPVVTGAYHPDVNTSLNLHREISISTDSQQVRLQNDSRTPHWGVVSGHEMEEYLTVGKCPDEALRSLSLEFTFLRDPSTATCD